MRIFVVLAALLAPTDAHAQARFEMSVGAYRSDALENHETGDDADTGGVVLGAMLTGRVGDAELGAVLDHGGGVYGGTTSHGGLVGGVTAGTSFVLRAFGEVGVSYTTGIGDDLFSEANFGETEVVLPYAGARRGLAHAVGDGDWLIGLAVVARKHLATVLPSVATAQAAWRQDAWIGMFASDSTYNTARPIGDQEDEYGPQVGALVVRRAGNFELGAILDLGLGVVDAPCSRPRSSAGRPSTSTARTT